MDGYYDSLTKHKLELENAYNHLIEIWEKSKKAKSIQLVDERDYTSGKAVIYNNDKYYIIALELVKGGVHVHLRNHATDLFIADEICWYGNHDIKTLVIDEIARHLGYDILTGENKETKKNKKKK